MRLRFLTGVWIVAAGAIVTWALAWTCALWSPVSLQGWGSRTNDSPWLAFRHERGIGIEIYHISPSHVVWPEEKAWAQMTARETPDWVMCIRGDGRLQSLANVGAGWPFVAFTARISEDFSNIVGPLPAPRWQDAYIIRRAGVNPSSRDRIVPYGILFAGLALNTLFWSGAIATALSLFVLVRRRVRRFRGCCPRCGYALRYQGGHAPTRATGCPECGWNRRDSGKGAAATDATAPATAP